MIVRKGAEGEGSRYQVIYRRTSYPTLEEHTPQILQQYTEQSATKEEEENNQPSHRIPPFSPPSLLNPLTPSPLPLPRYTYRMAALVVLTPQRRV